jgi:predicted Zn-dependent peptidase
MHDKILHNQLDLIITYGAELLRAPELNKIPVSNTQYDVGIIISKKHPLSRKDALGIEDIQDEQIAVLGQELSKSAFSNHPYATSAMLTEESSASITLEDVKTHYSTLLNANRLAFVVVGDFTGSAQKDMRALLDSYFGTLEQADYTIPDIPVAEVSEGAVYAPCTVAADTGYIAGYFACPERTSDDYVAFAIALMYLDDIMFAQVREQHGAVYSIGSGVFGGRQLLGALSIYKATEKEQLKHYVYDAIESFPTEDEIAKTLDQYKNKYITTLFSNSQTITGVAGNVVASLAYYNSPTQYLNRATQVQAVTAEDVARVYRRYIARSAERAENGNVNPICWVIISGEETLHQFAF